MYDSTFFCNNTFSTTNFNQALCEEEEAYVYNRQKLTRSALLAFFDSVGVPKFDHASFLENYKHPLTVSLAFSGGGYRSMLTGSGALAAFDIRTPCQSNCGNLGNLLQGTSYIGGISGGAFLVMSTFTNDFKPVHELLFDGKTWNFQEQLLQGIPSFDPDAVKEDMHILDVDDSGSNLVDSASNKMEKLLDFNWGIADTVMKYLGFGKTHESIASSKTDSLIEAAKSRSYLESFIKPIFLKKNISKDTANESGDSTLKEAFTFFKDLQIEVRSKKEAGFYISFTDYWGRALARKIFQPSARIPGATITSATLSKSFQSFLQPFPIVCSVQRSLEESSPEVFPNLLEFSPFEFGSWLPEVNSFAKMKYLGTSLYDGHSIHPTENPNVSVCTSGFDNIGFITGTSSSLFNHIFIELYKVLFKLDKESSANISKILTKLGLITKLDTSEYPQHPDYALYSPNPFYGYRDSSNQANDIFKERHLYLADGGDSGENIPFYPFLQESRKVDIIIAFDMTSDIANFPNGTTLTASQKRFHQNSKTTPTFSFGRTPSLSSRFDRLNYNKTNPRSMRYINKAIYPYVPSPQTIIDEKLNQRPVFLGCDIERDYPEFPLFGNTSNATKPFNSGTQNETLKQYLPPIIVYNSNYNHSFDSNRSTFQLSYTSEEVLGMVENGYNLATFKNSTEYSVCLACAVLKRLFDRIMYGITPYPGNLTVPSACLECYSEFCYHK